VLRPGPPRRKITNYGWSIRPYLVFIGVCPDGRLCGAIGTHLNTQLPISGRNSALVASVTVRLALRAGPCWLSARPTRSNRRQLREPISLSRITCRRIPRAIGLWRCRLRRGCGAAHGGRGQDRSQGVGQVADAETKVPRWRQAGLRWAEACRVRGAGLNEICSDK
jgi:hypothetical protein